MPFPAEVDTALKLIEIVSIVLGGGALFYRTGRMTMKFEQIGEQQSKEIGDIKETLKALAATAGRFDRVEERQLLQGKRLDRLESKIDAVS